MTTHVLLMARAPEAEPLRPELAELLGPARYVRLKQMLLTRAAAWAAGVAPGRVHVAVEPAEAEASLGAPVAGEPSLRPLVGGEAELFPQAGDGASARLAAAAERIFSAGGAPVLIAWPELPRWRPEHAAGALGDLADGCEVSVGPLFDGGFYLVALARFVPEVFALSDAAWRGPQAMGRMLATVHQAGLGAGLLRAERALRRPADVRAELADPLLDEELRDVLDLAP